MTNSETGGKVYRDIIKIDQDLCTGCGICANGCPEGAIQIIDGKARLVSELFCDGLGACIGDCPEGAITVEKREAQPYDEWRVMDNVVTHGQNTIKAHLEHLIHHDQGEFYKIALEYLGEHGITVPDHDDGNQSRDCDGAREFGGCPSTRTFDFTGDDVDDRDLGDAPAAVKSQLRQWPIQLKLLNPNASYFRDADLVIAADCVPFVHGNFHHQFLKGKALVMFCPKLDPYREEYINKMASIMKNNEIKSIQIVHMQLPCCFGTAMLVEEAMKRAGKSIPVDDVTISIRGEILEI
ncbi:MAG: ATP-binding protein [Promethearchaeota archaeon]